MNFVKCQLSTYTYSTAVLPVGLVLYGCQRVCPRPLEFSSGPWIPASWTIWTVEAASSGSGQNPDLPDPPAWDKKVKQLIFSSLHIISSGINGPQPLLSAPMCASRSMCVCTAASQVLSLREGIALLWLLCQSWPVFKEAKRCNLQYWQRRCSYFFSTIPRIHCKYCCIMRSDPTTRWRHLATHPNCGSAS